MNPLLRGLNPTAQLVLFLTITLTCIGLGSVTAMGIGVWVFGLPLEQLPAVLTNPMPEYANALMWMNNVSQLFGFLLPVWLFMLLFGGKNVNHLLIRRGGLLVMLSPVLIIVANGIIDLTAKLNVALIPENSWLERTVKPTEELAERMTALFLDADSPLSIAAAFISIAVIPAICEEFSFRGVVQPLLGKMTGNVHVAVWVTAILFSLVHVQFYGFLPRVLMGALLGYVVIWSGTIWASVLAHFVNNALAFMMYRVYGSMETPDDSVMSEWYFYVMSALLTAWIVIVFIRKSRWPWLSFEYLSITDKMSQGHESIEEQQA